MFVSFKKNFLNEQWIEHNIQQYTCTNLYGLKSSIWSLTE